MKITAPYGYGEIIPLRKDQRVRMSAGGTPAFCRRLNAIALSAAEFVAAARDYPIVFMTFDDGKTFAPAAVTGLDSGSNLFVDAAGEWDRGAYLPAFVRRYPFCLSKLYVDGAPQGERVVCVAAESVDAGGTLLFSADGQPTAPWRDAERLLGEFEADLDRTAQACAALARLQLFEPFAMEVLAEDRSQVRLAGMHRVTEARLRDQKAATHKMLVEQGLMGLVYAHLHSLENFSRLAARRRSAGGTG
jgi:hypothetical protein